MIKKTMAALTTAALAACTVGGAENTSVYFNGKRGDEVAIRIHISLLNHPPETHILGYDKMQRLADVSCVKFGKNAAQYTGNQERQTLGNSYDTWLERTYRCI